MSILSTDPIVFDRDVDGHLLFPLRLVSGPRAVEIGALTRLRMIAGEFFADRTAGPAYLETDTVPERLSILGQKFNPDLVATEFRRELLTTPGLASVTSIRVSFDGTTRRVSAAVVVLASWGDTLSLNLEVQT